MAPLRACGAVERSRSRRQYATWPATRPSLSAYASRPGSGAVVGAAYGVVVWIVAAGFVMPIWLTTVLMEPPAVAHFDPTSLVGHVVFGVLLGAGYAILANR